MQEDQPIEWLKPKDFEQIFGITRSTQAKMRMKRLIPFSKFGKFIYYNRAEIDKLFQNHKIEVKNV